MLDHPDGPMGPSRSVQTDDPPDLSKRDPSETDLIDAEQQATDLAVGVRVPRGVPAAPQFSGL